MAIRNPDPHHPPPQPPHPPPPQPPPPQPPPPQLPPHQLPSELLFMCWARTRKKSAPMNIIAKRNSQFCIPWAEPTRYLASPRPSNTSNPAKEVQMVSETICRTINIPPKVRTNQTAYKARNSGPRIVCRKFMRHQW